MTKREAVEIAIAIGKGASIAGLTGKQLSTLMGPVQDCLTDLAAMTRNVPVDPNEVARIVANAYNAARGIKADGLAVEGFEEMS